MLNILKGGGNFTNAYPIVFLCFKHLNLCVGVKG
jgi:hypothetical protein